MLTDQWHCVRMAMALTKYSNMREASCFFASLHFIGWKVMFLLAVLVLTKVKQFPVEMLYCFVAELGLNQRLDKTFIITIILLLACVNIAAAATLTHDESHCDCLFVVVFFLVENFHGSLDWSRSTKTGTHKHT